MFVDIARFLLEILGSLLVALLILRAWMRYIGMPTRNQVSHFTFAMTNWLIVPLSRLLPARGRIDWTSIVAAYLVTLLVVLALRGLFGAPMPLDVVLVAALRQLVIWSLNIVIWVTIIYAVISWVNPHAPFAPAFDMLLRPLLAPIRRVLPAVGGFDLSPLVLLIGVYVLQMVIARL